MAWHDITHVCGHKETQQLYGKSSQRESRISYLKKQLCTKCGHKASDAMGVLANVEIDLASGKKTIFITRSFAVKDALKSRGYIYSSTSKGAGWGLAFSDESGYDAELAWIRTQGWEIVIKEIPIPVPVVYQHARKTVWTQDEIKAAEEAGDYWGGPNWTGPKYRIPDLPKKNSIDWL